MLLIFYTHFLVRFFREKMVASGSAAIDTDRLTQLLARQRGSSAQVTGKILNVVNQVPFECVLNRNEQQQQQQPRAAFFRQRRTSDGSAPISQLARRRSTIAELGETPQWRLSLRRGHSAMYAGIDSLKAQYPSLYIGATGNIVSETRDHVAAEQLTDRERDSLRSLLLAKHDMVPVFIDDKLAYGHYEGYCKQGKNASHVCLYLSFL